MSSRQRRAKRAPAVTDSPETGASRWWLLPLLFAAVVLAYQPAWHGGILWDDDAYLTPPALRSLQGLWRIWFDPSVLSQFRMQYYPLSYSAFWLQHALWGDATLGYHLVNIALHSVSAFLLALLLLRLGTRGALIAAVLFALHPVHVESVAWITELKNTLSGTLYLGAALAYVKYDESRDRRYYIGALIAFTLALLSKTVTSTLPFALLVMFWWKRGRLTWKDDVRPLVPFLALGIGGGLLTAWIERTYIGAGGTSFAFTPIDRVLIAGRVFWFYLSKLVWPTGLMFIYPRWEISQAVWWQFLFPFAAIVLAGGLWAIRGWSRAPLAAVLFFGGTLVPALGFVDVYPFQFSFVADHFQYLASIGILALIAAALSVVAEGMAPSRQAGVMGLAILVALPLGALTWKQSRQYVDADTLYRSTIASNPACWLCENNLGGLALRASQDVSDETIAHFTRALALNPDHAPIHNNLGISWRRRGEHDRALEHFQKAVRLEAGFAEARYNLGLELYERKDYEGAIGHLTTYAEIGRDESLRSQARSMAGRSLMAIGRSADAGTVFRDLIAREPTNAAAHHDLGLTLVAAGKDTDAVEPFARSVALDPQNAAYRQDLGNALAAAGRLDEAIASYRKGLEIAPANVRLHNALGVALAASGRGPEALAEFQRSLQLDPNNQETRTDMETALRLVQRGR